VLGLHVDLFVDGSSRDGLFFGALRRGLLDGAGRLKVSADQDFLRGKFIQGSFEKNVTIT
jgi:hypothetical protein